MKFSQMLIAFAVVSFVCVQAKYQKDGNDTVSATLAARNAFFARRAEAYDELDHEIQGTCATNCVSNIIDAVQKIWGRTNACSYQPTVRRAQFRNRNRSALSTTDGRSTKLIQNHSNSYDTRRFVRLQNLSMTGGYPYYVSVPNAWRSRYTNITGSSIDERSESSSNGLSYSPGVISSMAIASENYAKSKYGIPKSFLAVPVTSETVTNSDEIIIERMLKDDDFSTPKIFTNPEEMMIDRMLKDDVSNSPEIASEDSTISDLSGQIIHETGTPPTFEQLHPEDDSEYAQTIVVTPDLTDKNTNDAPYTNIISTVYGITNRTNLIDNNASESIVEITMPEIVIPEVEDADNVPNNADDDRNYFDDASMLTIPASNYLERMTNEYDSNDMVLCGSRSEDDDLVDEGGFVVVPIDSAYYSKP
eukprot:679723_1